MNTVRPIATQPYEVKPHPIKKFLVELLSVRAGVYVKQQNITIPK